MKMIINNKYAAVIYMTALYDCPSIVWSGLQVIVLPCRSQPICCNAHRIKNLVLKHDDTKSYAYAPMQANF